MQLLLIVSLQLPHPFCPLFIIHRDMTPELLKSPRLLDLVISGVDFADAGFGDIHHLLGQAPGDQLVRMVLTDQFPVGLFDLTIAGLTG